MAKRKRLPKDLQAPPGINEQNARKIAEDDAKRAERARRARYGPWVVGRELTLGSYYRLVLEIEAQEKSGSPDGELVGHWLTVIDSSPGADDLTQYLDGRLGRYVTPVKKAIAANRLLCRTTGKRAEEVDQLKLTEAARLLREIPERSNPPSNTKPVLCARVDVARFHKKGPKYTKYLDKLQERGDLRFEPSRPRRVFVWFSDPEEHERFRLWMVAQERR